MAKQIIGTSIAHHCNRSLTNQSECRAKKNPNEMRTATLVKFGVQQDVGVINNDSLPEI